MREWKKWPIREAGEIPKDLKRIRPVIKKLYYRGNWEEGLVRKSLAIVGSRRMTRYGREVIEKFMPDLVASKTTIISGFMFGVDAWAHEKCLELGGKTIAVLGGGLDYLYPPENDKLYTQILEKDGMVISEYESNFVPTLWSFPQRNRIVAGLSTLGVLIVEAGVKSGSLITAKLARQQRKTVWAVPGPITSRVSEGTNFLIKNNLAKAVTEVSDILGQKGETKQEELWLESYDELERKILEILCNEEMTIDEMARKLQRGVEEISVKVSILSMKNIVEEEAGKIYLIKP